MASHTNTDSLDPQLLLSTLKKVKNGDFSVRLPSDARGIAEDIYKTINHIIELNEDLKDEVLKVRENVGKKGKLRQRVTLRTAKGAWQLHADVINELVDDLTEPIVRISDVIDAVVRGDLSRKIEISTEGKSLKGEFLKNAKIVNNMIDQFDSFTSEVNQVAKAVGKDGILGKQAEVRGIAGIWRELTDNVNSMANNLTEQVRNIAEITTAVANGDLSRKITVNARGELFTLKETVNKMVDQLNSFASEVTRVAKEVGTEGILGGQARVDNQSGIWAELTANVNAMADNLTEQVRNIAEITTAVANGDLSRKITVNVRGELFTLKETVNKMVDQLNSFASEVTRVAKEVGTEGILGGQARVDNQSGIWAELTANVNFMANNLTEQVRNIAEITTAVANGDLSRKITVSVRGELFTLKETVNKMVDQLNSFASEVTRVAKEVGTEGILGGQARVDNQSGIWAELTANVNRLAANLTTQVRAITRVAAAVTRGDLDQTITVQAQGEVEVLKNNINEMTSTLSETIRINSEQNWLKTNLAQFARLLQGQTELNTVAKSILSELALVVEAQHGVFYLIDTASAEQNEPVLKLLSSYAFQERKNLAHEFKLGQGLVGQCALEKQRIVIRNVPGDYIKINSALGEAKPCHIVVLPILFENTVLAVIELASFSPINTIRLTFLDQLAESIGVVLNTIQASVTTQDLLKQSQTLTEELQTQQEELQQTNEELEEKAQLLVEQKNEVEKKNREVEQARKSLQEKAAQLALTSKYKSQFLANMSHEFRTPLNSLLILAELLSQNPQNNMTPKQVEFAQTILGSSRDLLNLINEILDLSRIEAGKVSFEMRDFTFEGIKKSLLKTFTPAAKEKKLDFRILLESDLPGTMHSDYQKIIQILNNLLSNAIKFTDKGQITVTIGCGHTGWDMTNTHLNSAQQVIAFSVTDTGIGIPGDQLKNIFEAFQQVDGSTSRKYGGTGLGLSISRELASLLGGDIQLESKSGEGSRFTLYLPRNYPVLSPNNDDQMREEHSGQGKPVSQDHWQKQVNTVPEEQDQIKDDRENIKKQERVLLIIEDDVRFAKILFEQAHEFGFKVIVALTGEEGLYLINKYLPQAITLDIELPDMKGWVILDQIKHNLSTRHIPVHIISVHEIEDRALQMGAVDIVKKPVNAGDIKKVLTKLKGFIDKKAKNLLIVEDNEIEAHSLTQLIGNGDVKITTAQTGEKALSELGSGRFECMILDLKLPDMSGFELIEKLRKELKITDIPIIIYTGKKLTKKEETELKRVAETIIIKDVKSPERLLDETALFLHRVEKSFPEEKKAMIRRAFKDDKLLKNKKILIVDDDLRNIFALTSILEQYQMQVFYRENGRECLEFLNNQPAIDLILMDIMMPEMDGYETMEMIRKKPDFLKLPIIALTAKAMKGDREKSIKAGASDYITKPINTEQLLSLLRVWLYQ